MHVHCILYHKFMIVFRKIVMFRIVGYIYIRLFSKNEILFLVLWVELVVGLVNLCALTLVARMTYCESKVVFPTKMTFENYSYIKFMFP